MMLGAAPGKIAAEYGLPQRCVTFRKVRIDLYRSPCCFISRRGTLHVRHHAEDAEPVVITGDARMRQSVFRIERDRLLVTDDGSREALFSKRVPVKTSAQV